MPDPHQPLGGTEEQHRLLMECVTDYAIVLTDAEGRIVTWNAGAERILGYSQEEIVGQHFSRFFTPEDIQRGEPERELQIAAELGRASDERWHLRKDGARFWCSGITTALREQDQVRGYAKVMRDLTERKRSEEQVEFHSRLLDAVGQAVIATEPEGRIIYWSRFAETLYGWSPSEALGRNILEVTVPASAAPQAAEVMEDLRAGRSWTGEFLVRRRDGKEFPALVTNTPVFDSEGRLKAIIGVSTDITERKRRENALRFLADASESLATLVDYRSTLQKIAHLAVPDFADWCAVDMVEQDGSLQRVAVAHANPSQVELAQAFSDHPPDAAGSHVVGRVLASGESEVATEITDASLTRLAQDEERLRILRRLGVASYLCVPLQSQDRTLGVLTFLATESGRRYDSHDLILAENLAHRAAVAIENARLYQAVQDADRRKDEFLAMLAHELRNPLAPIRSGLDILMMEQQGDPEIVRVMHHQVEHLVRMVDDLLDASRIIRGKVHLRKEPVELAAVLRQSVESTKEAMESKEQELAVVAPERAIWLNADPVRLVQIVVNLLSNASKYTDRGGRIELVVQPEDREARISVRDNGIGIEPELLPKVFDLFTQSSRALDRAQGGLGIGLTLVRSLVEKHGGSITAHSEGVGQGSEFVVRLPVIEADRRAKAAAEPNPKDVQSRRVLVVDDNVGAAQMLSHLLARLGSHDVEVAHDGPSALATLDEFRPELVLLDIGLPGMDGYQVARAIRENPEHRDVLLVALTGYGQEEDRRRSKAAGFDEHLVKPPAMEEIESLFVHPKLAK